MRATNPIERERTRRESAAVLRIVARSPKRLASAAGVSRRYAEMLVAGDRDNLLGQTGEFLKALASERGRYARALEYLESMASEGEMDVREVAPETDYQAALQELHDQATAILPRLMAEARGEPNPAAMHEAALDVAEAARLLMIRARQLQAAQRKERRAA